MSKAYKDIHGIVLLDKPLNLSSNTALQIVKRLYQARKAGHTGSLDPLASGMLPLCLGEATKFAGFLLDTDKRYRTVCRLGITTVTGDAEGEVIAVKPVAGFTRAKVEEVLSRFTGPLTQIPPMYSALKHAGQPLYRLARRGLSVERTPREVVIHSLKLLRYEGEELDLDVYCSKGTYIRTLAEDIGAALGCGAHVAALRRVSVGGFSEGQMHSLADLQRMAAQGADALEQALLPMQCILEHWPEVSLSDDAAYYLGQGQAVRVAEAPQDGWVKLYSRQGFLGIGQVLADGRVAPKRLINPAA
jgi:tRNA pseudouridine55 synthase